jgi:hypothetical protein
VPIGFVLLSLGILRPELIGATAAVHGWTNWVTGVMTLAVMTRASLGHTGRPLTATTPIQLMAILVAALARIVAAFGVLRDTRLYVSAMAWALALPDLCSFTVRCSRRAAHDRQPSIQRYCRLEIYLAWSDRSLTVRTGQSALQVLLEAGLPIEPGWLTGGCGMCATS